MFSRIALAAMTLTSPALAQAHEILVLPGQAKAQSVPITVLMTEDFIKPDRVPPLDAFTLERIEGKSRAIIPVTAADKALQTSVASGPAVLLASLVRDRMKAPKAKDGEAAPPARMTRVADYAKSYVGQTADTRDWEKPAGSRLEVMPLSNPAMLKVGDTLRVRVLFEGVPIESMVQATFDGNGRGWPVRLQSNTAGEASIPIDRAGHWIIRAKHQREETADTHIFYDGAANIIVNVLD